MLLISAKKGDRFDATEMDVMAVLNNLPDMLNRNGEFKHDTEIHFIRKRKR